MTEGSFPIYTAPPVIEAVIQLTFADALIERNLDKIARRCARRYENDVEGQNVKANIDFLKRETSFVGTPQRRITSSDEADILLLELSSATWSRLAPYEGWAPFLERLMADLEDVHAVAGYRRLARVGVRYINRIDVPAGQDCTRYEDYLSVNLNLPDKWDLVNAYGWRFEREFNDGLYGIVQSATVEPEVPGHGSFLLDIDIASLRDLPVKRDDLLARLELMRHLKNEIFETCITDVARERYSR